MLDSQRCWCPQWCQVTNPYFIVDICLLLLFNDNFPSHYLFVKWILIDKAQIFSLLVFGTSQDVSENISTKKEDRTIKTNEQEGFN
jgi:hypothetical protein